MGISVKIHWYETCLDSAAILQPAFGGQAMQGSLVWQEVAQNIQIAVYQHDTIIRP